MGQWRRVVDQPLPRRGSHVGQHRSRTGVEDGLEQLGRDRAPRMPDCVDARESWVQIARTTPIAGGRVGDTESRQLPVGDSPELARGQLGDANLGELVRGIRTDLPRFERRRVRWRHLGDSRQGSGFHPGAVRPRARAGSTFIDSSAGPLNAHAARS